MHTFLKWRTPLEGEWNSNMLSITHENEGSFEYVGRLFKRAVPELSDFEVLYPRVEKSGSLILSEGYKFFNTGIYNIKLSFYASINGKRVLIESNSVELNIIDPDVKDISLFTFLHP